MKIKILSDLHTEFSPVNIIKSDADVLVLAGDIAPGCNHTDWMKQMCDEYSHVIYVLGNHEYYMHDMVKVENFWREFDCSNYYFLQMGTVVIDGKTFAGCTLWTDFDRNNPITKYQVIGGMNDYRVIYNDGRVINGDDTYNLHMDHSNWLMSLKNVDVVVTHHAPTWQSVQPQFSGDILNGGFAANCDNVIETLRPRLWIHGHMHDYINYYHNLDANNTQIICNPRGYQGVNAPNGGEETGWNEKFTIEI